MITKERKKYLDSLVAELKKELNSSTSLLYEDFLNSAFDLADNVWAKADKHFQSTMPVTVGKEIVNCALLNNKSTQTGDIKYRFAHVPNWENSNAIFDLQLLKEHLEADGFLVSFYYDEKGPRDDELYDSISVSIPYENLKELKETKQK